MERLIPQPEIFVFKKIKTEKTELHHIYELQGELGTGTVFNKQIGIINYEGEEDKVDAIKYHLQIDANDKKIYAPYLLMRSTECKDVYIELWRYQSLFVFKFSDNENTLTICQFRDYFYYTKQLPDINKLINYFPNCD